MSNRIMYLLLVIVLFCSSKRNVRQFELQGSSSKLEYIIFGIFCGECTQNCAIMYRINLNNYKEKFLIDSSDSFFKNQGKIHFDKNYSDDKKVDLAKSIIAQIPNSFFKAMNKNTFGCPDCSDGCGVYFEFRNKGEIKKFYIDTDTTKLTEPVKSFEINIRKVISKLGNATD